MIMENELTGKKVFRNYNEFGDSDIALTLRCLTEQKSLIKLDVQQAEDNLSLLREDLKKVTQNLKDKKEDLLLNTDFEALKITNQPKRNAYVNKHEDVKKIEKEITDYETHIKEAQKNVQYSQNRYDMITEEQSNYKLLIRLEISRRQTAQETVLAEPDLDKLLEAFDNTIKAFEKSSAEEYDSLITLEDLEKGAE